MDKKIVIGIVVLGLGFGIYLSISSMKSSEPFPLTPAAIYRDVPSTKTPTLISTDNIDLGSYGNLSDPYGIKNMQKNYEKTNPNQCYIWSTVEQESWMNPGYKSNPL